MRRSPLFSVLLLTVAGCVQPVQYWVGPGGSDTALEAASAACAADAGRRFPPVSLGQPGFYPTPMTQCIPTPGGTNCVIIGSGYLPQARSAADTNAPPRAAAFRSCMMAAGWRPLTPAADGRLYLPPDTPGGRS